MHSAPERHSTLTSAGQIMTSPCSATSGSGELAQRRLAIPESHPRSFDEILAETSHTVIGCDAGFVEQRLGSLARTDRFQVSECIHDELQSAGLIHERLAALVGQDDSDGVEQLRRRAGQLTVGPEDGAALELGAADLRRNEKGRGALLLDRFLHGLDLLSLIHLTLPTNREV